MKSLENEDQEASVRKDPSRRFIKINKTWHQSANPTCPQSTATKRFLFAFNPSEKYAQKSNRESNWIQKGSNPHLFVLSRLGSWESNCWLSITTRSPEGKQGANNPPKHRSCIITYWYRSPIFFPFYAQVVVVVRWPRKQKCNPKFFEICLLFRLLLVYPFSLQRPHHPISPYCWLLMDKISHHSGWS